MEKNMQQQKKYIFDLDGTLYSFAGSGQVTFGTSIFYADLRERITLFISRKLEVNKNEAEEILIKVGTAFNGELGIGFEKTYGIDRYEYYESTWACDPENYITFDAQLAEYMKAFTGRSLLLTAAPRAWATKAITHLGLGSVFGNNIITGEPDIRKPNPAVFVQAAQILHTRPEDIISIGDQNHSDILPAKSLGMTTILIGPERLDAHYHASSIHDAIKLLKETL